MTDDADIPPVSPFASAHVAFSRRLSRRTTQTRPAPKFDPATHEQVSFDEAVPPLLRPVHEGDARTLDYQTLPLERIRAELLPRAGQPDPRLGLEPLCRSLQTVGLSNPIVVQIRADGDGFELIEGARRLEAFRRLRDQTGDPEWRDIPALVLPVDTDLVLLYRRMMDGNVLRRRPSLAEMAHMADIFALDPETPSETPDEAVDLLFQSASAGLRRKVQAIIRLLDAIGDCLAFPDDVSDTLGVALDQAIRDDPSLAYRIERALAGWDNRSAQDEITTLRCFAGITDDSASEDEAEGAIARHGSAPLVGAAVGRYSISGSTLSIHLANTPDRLGMAKIESAIETFLTQIL